MQLALLHLDNAFDSQPEFISTCDKNGARQIMMRKDGAGIRLWGRDDALAAFGEKVMRALQGGPEPRLTFMGSGDFHHVTVYLLASALENHTGPITVIHFDNHPDWVKHKNGVHCGSWINRALEHPQVDKIITVGVCSDDLRLPEWKGANLNPLSKGVQEVYPYDHAPSRVRRDYGAGISFKQANGALHWKTIRSIGERNFEEHILSRIETEAVYLTIDKDVLGRDDAVTNWDQGRMRLPYLLSLIKEIGGHCRVVGADVTGDYSTPDYGGPLWTRISKRAEVFMDQPRGIPDLKQASIVNSAANHALLEILSEAMA
jgi:hypothetical protein